MTSKQAPTLSSIYEDDKRFGWLDAVAEPLQQNVKRLFATIPMGSRIKSALNGTPLQHRLHPAVIAVPIGSFTIALLFDLLSRTSSGEDRRGYQRAADIAVTCGLLGSIPAAKTGVADWVDLYDHRRRVGMAHALLNVAALGCYGGSLALRKLGSGSRGVAQICSGAGFGLLTLGGAVGGELVYTLGVNVPHNVYPKPPDEYSDVMSSAGLIEGVPVVVEAGRVPVLLLRREGNIYAVDNWCPHAGGPLSEGAIDGDVVECPWHQSRFCLADGRAIQGPAASPLRTFEVKEEHGRILVKPSYEGQSWPPPPSAPQQGPETVGA
jgi:nitrite reductase/ring-hydroxylating ferredoxin subunit/uncharacterized membrane protein